MRLALTLGMTLAQLEATMTQQELVSWVALDLISPWFVPNIINSQLAQLCYLTFASHTTKPKSLKPNDFLYGYTDKPKQDNWSGSLFAQTLSHIANQPKNG